MRRSLVLLLLLLPAVFAAGAEETEKKKPAPPDPVAKLPKCLQPGITAVYDRAASGKTLAGTVTYTTKAGAQRGLVELTLTYDTGDRGVLSFRDRLVTRLDAKNRRLTFEYAIAGKKGTPYVAASQLSFTIDQKGAIDRRGKVRLSHDRFIYGKKDEKPRVKTTRQKPDVVWVPEPLEPFLAALHEVPEAQPFSLAIMTVLTGTIGKKPARYQPLGEGKMRIGEKSVECRIFSRVRGDDRSMIYLRKSDSLPLKANGLTLRLPAAEAETKPRPKTEPKAPNDDGKNK